MKLLEMRPIKKNTKFIRQLLRIRVASFWHLSVLVQLSFEFEF